MDQLNLKVAIDLALGDISDWGETEKAFVQELREKMNGYILKIDTLCQQLL